MSSNNLNGNEQNRSLEGVKTLVTGAGGFIGSHLVERLVVDGADVRAFLHYNSRSHRGLLEQLPYDVLENVEIFWGDLRDANNVRKAVEGVEGVFHLGALIGIPYSYHAPDAYVATNIGGTLNVLQGCADESVDFLVHTSTSEIYGSAQWTPMDEEHPIHAQSPYAASKIAADQLAQSFHLSFDLPVATIRPFNAYGPRQSARAVIPTIISQALEGGEIRLGATDTLRDFTYVADTVEAFLRMATTQEAVGEVINIGSGREVSIGELAEIVIDLCDSDAAVVQEPERLRPQKSEVTRLLCDSSKAQEILGWEPSYALESGLQMVIAYISSQSEQYRTNTYAV